MRSANASLWEQAQARWNALRALVGFSDELTALPSWLAPPLAVGALLTLAVLAGIGVASLGLLFSVVVAAHLLLQQVFGLRIDVTLPR